MIEIQRISKQLEDFEASKSISSIGTGTRREGAGFESLVAQFWDAVAQEAVFQGATSRIVHGAGSRRWNALSFLERVVYLPASTAEQPSETSEQPHPWLELVFRAEDLVASYPGESEAVRRFSPFSGPYADDKYPEMYIGLKTKFDDTILFVENDTLREKILLEYKTAKSSNGNHIDGNAHERLSFQIMQYMEIATMYPKCSLVIFANGAFSRYRNKYHVGFNIQAMRLSAFGWFSMRYECQADGFVRVAKDVLDWLAGQVGTSDLRIP